VSGTVGDGLRPSLESTAYFAVAEALANAVKHSAARAIAVEIERARDTLTITVSDDGRGGADPLAGTGLRGLDERLAPHGGRLAIASPPGAGTRVRLELPTP
jgi:signal transduction histidine kinase